MFAAGPAVKFARGKILLVALSPGARYESGRTAMKYWASLMMVLSFAAIRSEARDWVVYEGKEGPGQGRHIVFITGDEEYRSEEGMPMLAKILAVRHGFKCTVLFPINPADGTIDPNNQTNIVGLQALEHDVCLVVRVDRAVG